MADANEIEYEPRECHHQGDCRGTCPACEAEVRYIQQQLDIRRQLGKAVAVFGISAGLAALNSCAIDNDSFAIPAVSVENAVPRRLVGDVIDDFPEFPGGSKKMFEYLMENTHYQLLDQVLWKVETHIMPVASRMCGWCRHSRRYTQPRLMLAISESSAAPLASGKFTWNRAIFVFFKRFIWKLSRKCLYLQAIE